MKTLISVVILLVAASLFITRVNNSGNSNTKKNKQIDSLITAYNYKFDQWRVYPYFSKQWINGKTINESYLVAEFVNLEGGLPDDKTRLSAFSAQLATLIQVDLKNKNAFEGLRVQVEDRRDYIIFTSKNWWRETFLFSQEGQLSSR